MTKTLKNENCLVEYREIEKEIFGRDLRDLNNEPAFYSKTKRGIAKAWAEIEASFNDRTRMSDLIDICTKHGIRTHYWCMMD